MIQMLSLIKCFSWQSFKSTKMKRTKKKKKHSDLFKNLNIDLNSI